MKIKRMIATALCAAAAFTAVGGLVACGSDDDGPAGLGKTNSVKLSDYYYEVSKTDGIGKSSLNKLNNDGETFVQCSDDYVILKDAADKYSVFFTQVNSKASDLEEAPSVVECNFSGGWDSYFYAVRYTKSDSLGNVMCSYCAPDGTTLLPYDYYRDDYYYNSVSMARLVRYVGGSRKPSYVLRVNATVESVNGSGTSSVVKYFNIDSGDNVVFPEYSTKPKYVAVDESEISEQSPDYSDGNTVGAVPSLTDIQYTASDSYVGGEIGKYKYNTFGSNYYFYKNNKKTGSVNIGDGETLGFLGDNFYYYTVTPVSPDSKSYNTVVQANSTTVKAQYKLYRYNVVKNSRVQLDTDVMVLSFKPMYNRKKQAYDAAIVTGLKLTGGVFYVMQSSGSVVSGDDAKLITDGDLRVAYDISDTTGDYSVGYKLSGDRYYLPKVQNGIIADKSLNYVCESGSNVYDSVKRIKFRGANGKYGLLDYDGKIKVPAEYSRIDAFYGGTAYCVKNVDGVNSYALIDADGNESVLTDTAESLGYGIYTVTTEQNGRYTLEIYNNQKVQLMSFNNLISTSSVTISFPYVRYGSDIYMFI